MLSKEKLPLLLGVIFWLLLGLGWFPGSPLAEVYVHWILLAAPLWLIPLAWRLLQFPLHYNWLGLAAAVSLSVAYGLDPGGLAFSLALPWSILCGWLSLQQLFRPFRVDVITLCRVIAFIYLSVGVFWVLANRLGYAPMDFDSIIVLLTGVHFHYAGFLLLILTAQLIPYFGKLGKVLAWGVMAGMPLVAIGITGEHIGLAPILESLAVTVMTSAGMGVGLAHLGLGWKNRGQISGSLFILGGLALFAGMSLGLLYGWRHFIEMPFLSIPWMYAVHGSLNAIGFAIPCLLGWFLFKKSIK